jgi:integrase
MRRKFYMHKRGGVFYACLVNRETGLSMSARSTGERRKVEAAFDLDGILRGIRKAELDSGAALAIVKALKGRGLIDIGAVPAGKGSVSFTDFLTQFFDYEKSPYVRDRLAHGHSIGRSYCRESLKVIRLFWEPAFKGRTLASITRNGLKSFSLSLPADKSASYKNSILNAGLIPLGWAYEEGMIPADVAKDFERYSGKAGKRGVLTVDEAGTLFAKPWADTAAMAANLLSATTGMRQGEVLAIRDGDIGEGVLNVAHSWSAADGLKTPKNGEARNIVFHGWRHFYAARMADIEAADKVSRITGHKSRAVFDAYAGHVTEAAIMDMGKAAAVFAGVLAGAAMAKGPRV